jgi:hypothetical protein
MKNISFELYYSLSLNEVHQQKNFMNCVNLVNEEKNTTAINTDQVIIGNRVCEMFISVQCVKHAGISRNFWGNEGTKI